jgi:hypothetical protein
MKTSPTQRSLKLLRDRGWIAEKVEQRIPTLNVTRDFAGGVDIIAFRGELAEEGVLSIRMLPGAIVGVQTTTQANVGARRTKMLAEPRLRTWLEAGGQLWIHGWAKRNDRKPGSRKLWSCVEEELRLEDFHALRHVEDSGGPAGREQIVHDGDERVELGDGR